MFFAYRTWTIVKFKQIRNKLKKENSMQNKTKRQEESIKE